jgi:hypothetical protein
MTSPIFLLHENTVHEILLKHTNPVDCIKFFNTCRQLKKFDTNEFWKLKLKEYFLDSKQRLDSPLEDKETYKSRFQKFYNEELIGFKQIEEHYTKAISPLHNIFIAVHYGDWNESKFNLNSLGTSGYYKNKLIVSLLQKILNRAVYKTIHTKEIDPYQIEKRQTVLDKCFTLIYTHPAYLEALKEDHKNCSDAELFGLYNQVTRIQNLILSYNDRTKQLDLAKEAIISALKGPNELRSDFINQLSKNNEEKNCNSISDLNLAEFLDEDSEENHSWAKTLLQEAISSKREQTALFLLKRFSFKHLSNQNKVSLFNLAFDRQMGKVIDAIYNKFSLDDNKEIYRSLYIVAKENPNATAHFLEKIQNSGCYDQKLQLDRLSQLVKEACKNQEYPQLFRKYAIAVKAIYASFTKNYLPTEMATGEIKIEPGTKMLDEYMYTRYALAFSIQDMDFFKIVMAHHPLDKTNPEHYAIIADLVSKAPSLTEYTRACFKSWNFIEVGAWNLNQL